VVIADEVVGFLEGSEIAIWLATANAECVPQTARSMGARVDREHGIVSLFVPTEQGARLLANCRGRANVAATIVRVTDYRALQIKGELVALHEGRDDERAWPQRYRERFADVSARVGLARELIMQLTYWPCMVLDVRVAELYAQTPGPHAGARL
jgi:hypothetical protein